MPPEVQDSGATAQGADSGATQQPAVTDLPPAGEPKTEPSIPAEQKPPTEARTLGDLQRQDPKAGLMSLIKTAQDKLREGKPKPPAKQTAPAAKPGEKPAAPAAQPATPAAPAAPAPAQVSPDVLKQMQDNMQRALALAEQRYEGQQPAEQSDMERMQQKVAYYKQAIPAEYIATLFPDREDAMVAADTLSLLFAAHLARVDDRLEQQYAEQFYSLEQAVPAYINNMQQQQMQVQRETQMFLARHPEFKDPKMGALAQVIGAQVMQETGAMGYTEQIGDEIANRVAAFVASFVPKTEPTAAQPAQPNATPAAVVPAAQPTAPAAQPATQFPWSPGSGPETRSGFVSEDPQKAAMRLLRS